MVTLKASTNNSLHDAYHKVLDDLDNNKDLSFALIQDTCSRQFRRRPEDDHSDYPDTQGHNKGNQGVVRMAINKEFPRPKPGEDFLFFCFSLPTHSM